MSKEMVFIFIIPNTSFISLFLHESEQQGDLALTLKYGKEYLSVVIWGFVPFAISQSYGSTLRETGRPIVPMVASVVAVFVNLVFNYVFIFGHFGAPAMGVKGAALATVISRFIELGVVMVWTHTHKEKADFVIGAYSSLHIPGRLVKSIVVRGLPLMANELLWAAGVTFTNQCYSLRGLGVVAALNISSTIINVLNVVYMALGVSISIVVGNLLGAGKLEEAKDARIKLIATDGVFSMDGTVANLAAICDLADEYGALVMVDDSHATGFMGKTGRGTAEHCGVLGRVDIITGTFGKALGGASGGFTSGRREIIDLLRQRSRPYLFSNTLAPAVAAGSYRVLELIENDTSRRDKLFDNRAFFIEKVKELGLDIIDGGTPIIPIMLYDEHVAVEMAKRMMEKGIYVVAFSYPVVPKGRARIRTQISAALSKEDLTCVVNALREVKEEMGI